MKYRNASDETIYFRDDAGKHEIPSGESFDVVGDQHVEYVESIDGVESAFESASVAELRETAEAAGVAIPKSARKRDIVEALESAGSGPDSNGAAG